MNSAPPVYIEWPQDLAKPYVGLVKSEKGNTAYWPKFERFLKNNYIPYKELNIKRSDFIQETKDLNIIIWRTPSSYADQWEAEDKVFLLEDYLNKTVLPSKNALWFYENKVRVQWLLEINQLPTIKTFISYSKDETREFIEKRQYPFISKDKTSSASEGLCLIKNKRQAIKLWRKVFYKGLKLNNTYGKQKNYVLFQEFVPNNGFNLRVIIIGNSYFGYYRYPKKT